MKVIRGDRIPDAILTSDWHMMEPTYNPPCRLDNHYRAQEDKVWQIRKLQFRYQCPIFFGGDLFDYWKASPELVNQCLRIFPRNMGVVGGNHDFPQHSIELMDKSSFGTITYHPEFHFLYNQFSWNTYDKNRVNDQHLTVIGGRSIAVAHMMVWDQKEPYPGCKAPRTQEVFDMFPGADLILTGDNHETFTARDGDRLLINPGSLTRHRAIQVDHKPCVFLWYADTNTYQIHYLNIPKGVMTREHLDEVKEKENEKDMFMQKLDEDWDVEVSFEDNIHRAMEVTQLAKGIKKQVLTWMEK